MQGLRHRPTYNELIDYLEEHQEKIKYPDRRATFLRNSPYLSQFDNDSWIDLDEQERNIMEGQMRDLEMKKLAANTKQTHSEMKAVGSQTKPLKQNDIFDTESDSGFSDVEEFKTPRDPKPLFKDATEPETSSKPAEESMRLRGLVRGVGNVASNYVYPAMRDYVVPAMGDVAHTTLTQVFPSVARLVFNTTWVLADVLFAIRELGVGGDTHQALNDESSSSSSSKTKAADYMKQYPNKGSLVEEIYKRPGWGRLMGVAEENGYHSSDTGAFRIRLSKMSKKDLAEVLVSLDSKYKFLKIYLL
jgi:hypothetical protein